MRLAEEVLRRGEVSASRRQPWLGGVVAFVTEENALDQSLLGMTFLETLSRYSVTQNSLELAD